jgi:hypothetical protein
MEESFTWNFEKVHFLGVKICCCKKCSGDGHSEEEP